MGCGRVWASRRLCWIVGGGGGGVGEGVRGGGECGVGGGGGGEGSLTCHLSSHKPQVVLLLLLE